MFCPAAPEARRYLDPVGDAPGTDTTPLAATAMKGVDLPPLDALIEGGEVLALNMPAGTNPALARAVGVMLKNAWLQSLLRRPAAMKNEPGRYVRPAVFICDEYQAFKQAKRRDDEPGDAEHTPCQAGFRGADLGRQPRIEVRNLGADLRDFGALLGAISAKPAASE